MLNIGERFSSIAEKLELPPETAVTSQVLLSGSRQVTVEGHRGIRLYSPERIDVRTRQGCAAIHGQKLRVCFLNAGRAVIRGKIHAVTLEEAE